MKVQYMLAMNVDLEDESMEYGPEEARRAKIS